MNYGKALKSIMKEIGTNGDKLSYDLGMSYSYFRKSVNLKGMVTVLWVKSFVIGYYLGKKTANKNIENNEP